MEDNDELLPHVFMADVTRFVVALAERTADGEPLQRLQRFLEQGLQSGNYEVCGLIGVSFVENLCGESAAMAKLLPLFGAALRREVTAICGM